MLQMKLRSFKSILSLIILFWATSSLVADEKIDIWKDKKNQASENKELNLKDKENKIQIGNQLTIKPNEKITVENSKLDISNEKKVFGVYDPEDNNFNLNMWSATNAEDIRASLKRINKKNLSKTSSEILENILLSFSYPPEGMSDKEFVNLKLDWLINNNRTDLIENFLIQNKEFSGNSKAVQYLVDTNIAQANIKEGCEKIKFIDAKIKDSYLEKFKIYCLVFNNKNSQARLLLNLLREQKQSDNFFDDKINYLLGISETTTNKINEKNLLNFYLSSITIKDFKYEPTTKTKKEIWQYLNSANLIKLDDVKDKKKLKDLELAANEGRINKKIIFDIYQQISFNLNSLINAKNIYQTLDDVDARSLIYQKYLLSEDTVSKLDYLFLLDDLFRKNNLQKIYSEYLSEALKNIDPENIPENYKETVKNKILTDQLALGKIKYNDKILHQSKI